jgi:hypothetical protein
MDSQKPESKSDEIDLSQLFSSIGNSIKSGWMNFMRFLATLRRVPLENKWSFTLIIAASVIVGFTFSSLFRKNFYESKMILSSEFLNKELAKNIVDKLNGLAGEPSKKGLAAALNLPDSLAENIIGFDVMPFIEESDVVDVEILREKLSSVPETDVPKELIDNIIERVEIENRHAFEITIRTLNPGVILNLQEAVFNSFQRNPYIQKRIAISRENLNFKKKKLTRDLNKLDSLKSVIYQNYKTMAEQTRGSNNVILSDKAATNPTELYETDLAIYEEFQDVNRDLYLQKDLEVVDGFTAFTEPASPSRNKIIFYSLLIGIGLAYLEVALRTFNKYLANLG